MTTHSVMIIDDNPVDRMLAIKLIERSGRFAHAFAVNDGIEAIAMYERYKANRNLDPEKFPPLLVLLDINMPEMDGFTFLDRYRELELEIDDPHFILMLSSSSATIDVARAEADPLVHDYLIKPIHREIVEQLADTYLPR